jgi:aminoglycoside phosphotransferase (APT) family kinase protein
MLPIFVARFGSRLAPRELAIIERLGASAQAPLFQDVGQPFCLEHRDYRLDNFMIDESLPSPRVSVVDWQGMRTGRPLNDVVLCVAGGLEPAARREAEAGILRDYHAALCAAGVGGFEWTACWQEYRRAAFAGFGLTVVAAAAVEQTERGDEMFTAMAHRHACHALEVGAQEFLD